MKFDEVKINDRVYDDRDVLSRGRVVEILRTRLRVQWLDGTIQTYDRGHVQFLVKLR